MRNGYANWEKGSIVTYHLVIFDFDGTLADSFSWFFHVFDTLAERSRFPLCLAVFC
jgi:hypothetical protein